MRWLFESAEFVPKTACGGWVAILYIITNWAIAFSYYTIAITFFYYWRKKHLAIQKHWMIIIFIIFISLCGTIHLLDGLSFWFPIYRFLSLVDFITAWISLLTAGLLIPVIRYKLLYKTAKEYEDLQKILEAKNREEHEMITKIREINHELANRVQYLENTIAVQGWITERQLKLYELKHIVTNLREQYKEKIN